MIYVKEEAWKKYQDLMRERPQEFAQSEELMIVTDWETVSAFEKESVITIGLIYQSPYHLLVVDLVRDRFGHMYPYERLLPAVMTGGGSVGVPMLDGRYILLRQYRHSLRGFQYAFPRGFAEEGLTPEENIRKELREELGATVRETRLLGTLVSDSGLAGSRVSVFLCCLDDIAPRVHYEGIVGTEQLTPEEMKRWIAEGRITDGFTLAAYGMGQAAEIGAE